MNKVMLLTACVLSVVLLGVYSPARGEGSRPAVVCTLYPIAASEFRPGSFIKAGNRSVGGVVIEGDKATVTGKVKTYVAEKVITTETANRTDYSLFVDGKEKFWMAVDPLDGRGFFYRGSEADDPPSFWLECRTR